MPTAPGSESQSILALSTENGRILFYDIRKTSEAASEKQPPTCSPIAQLGGEETGFGGRIKDFEILQMPESHRSASSPSFVVTGSSDGAVRIWKFSTSEIQAKTEVNGEAGKEDGKSGLPQIGTVVGTHETGHRITCLVAFVMDSPQEHGADADEEEMPAEVDNSDSE